MNEFLQNLRNQTAAKERRYNKNQKPGYEGGNQPPAHHPERRGGTRPNAPLAPPRHDPHALQNVIEALVETQRDRVYVSERLAEAEERKAEALEYIADRLERLLEYFTSASYEASAAAPPASYTEEAKSVDLLDTMDDEVRKTSKKYIMKFIDKLRAENMTYEQIAKYLTDNNYPTFSGRGRWHAQTIHRLCKDNR